jgi:transposase
MSRYREWAIDQPLLLPPSVTEFVPPDHLCLFVRDLARGVLDLSEIERTYSRDPRGYPPYHPAMLVALLLYAYTQGIYSSRRIAKACEERVDFMALTAMQRPDFRTISDFRKRHLAALSGLFVQPPRDAGGAAALRVPTVRPASSFASVGVGTGSTDPECARVPDG